MSGFAWLSYSESERRKALDVISLFRERDTRDELGIGVIRDAFADLLFPGTSTIQTRARYFLFIPWVYQRLERKRVRSVEIVYMRRFSSKRGRTPPGRIASAERPESPRDRTPDPGARAHGDAPRRGPSRLSALG